ncbi:colicin immunity domain-containing protein [Xanthomonas arboricola]|uniref:colicin immunity domain-containing protein n=1 Tax=Xanthomonas arboricola TaxID=56448 RepID=UPI000C827A0B|nr:colicin immunity domain-containing protein [Xanthomonas arboricola]MCC8670551.1 colicin immunity domain-containing protein [Xanthomonas arboricola]
MKNRLGTYIDLLSGFVNGNVGALDFQKAYLEKFKKETARLDESIYNLLDAFFGDVDAYTDDQELLRENPSYYLDEKALRARASQVMSDLWNRRSARG